MVRTEVTVEPTKVMYVQAEGGLSGIRQAWNELESKLPSLKERRFYGTYLVSDKIYRACVAINNEKEPDTLKLPTWTILGENT